MKWTLRTLRCGRKSRIRTISPKDVPYIGADGPVAGGDSQPASNEDCVTVDPNGRTDESAQDFSTAVRHSLNEELGELQPRESVVRKFIDSSALAQFLTIVRGRYIWDTTRAGGHTWRPLIARA
jgi:hypothetical protein